MMSSSELQRISLATSKVVQPTGCVEIEPLMNEDVESTAPSNEEDDTDKEIDRNYNGADNSAGLLEPPVAKQRDKPLSIENNSVLPSNGLSSNSPNRGNETITSSIGDITVDSVRDHLNTTTTTLCSTTTEETVGKKTVFICVSLTLKSILEPNKCTYAFPLKGLP